MTSPGTSEETLHPSVGDPFVVCLRIFGPTGTETLTLLHSSSVCRPGDQVSEDHSPRRKVSRWGQIESPESDVVRTSSGSAVRTLDSPRPLRRKDWSRPPRVWDEPQPPSSRFHSSCVPINVLLKGLIKGHVVYVSYFLRTLSLLFLGECVLVRVNELRHRESKPTLILVHPLNVIGSRVRGGVWVL